MESRILQTEKVDCTHGIPAILCESAPTIQIPRNQSLTQNVLQNYRPSLSSGEQSKSPDSENPRLPDSERLTPLRPVKKQIPDSEVFLRPVKNQIPDSETISDTKPPEKRVLTISFEELHAWHQVLQNFKETIKDIAKQ